MSREREFDAKRPPCCPACLLRGRFLFAYQDAEFYHCPGRFCRVTEFLADPPEATSVAAFKDPAVTRIPPVPTEA